MFSLEAFLGIRRALAVVRNSKLFLLTARIELTIMLAGMDAIFFTENIDSRELGEVYFCCF